MGIRLLDPMPTPTSKSPVRPGPRAARPDVMGALLGVALTVVVVISGTPVWRAARGIGALGATGAGMSAFRRGGRTQRALLAVVAGLVGTVVGAGIGVMHLAKGDHSIVGYAALVALVAGLTGLGWGAVALVRTTRGWWRLLALPIAYLVFQFVVIPCTVAVYGTNAPRSTIGSVTPADRGLTYVDVSFRTTDHVRLSGWYIPSRNGSAVVLMHGSGETRSGVLDHAVVLARAGYGVLLFDARGHGRSGGDANEFGWYGDRDTNAAVTYLSGRADVHAGRIAAVGESMGGEEAIGAAASDTRIRAVVAEGALGRVPADTAWLPHDATGLISRAMNWIQAGVTDLLSGAPRPVGLRAALLAAAPRPVLLIAGRDEIAGDRAYRDASPNVELWELPTTAHTQGLRTHPVEWRSRVVTFLDHALSPTD